MILIEIFVAIFIVGWMAYVLIFSRQPSESVPAAVHEWCRASALEVLSLQIKNRFVSPFASASRWGHTYYFVRACVLEKDRRRNVWLLLEEPHVNFSDVHKVPRVAKTVWDDEINTRVKYTKIVWQLSGIIAALALAVLISFYFRHS